MNIPPFWSRATYAGEDPKGKSRTFMATGWSFHSLEEAKDKAAARAREIFDLITSGRKVDNYADYMDRPIREEIVDTLYGDGQPVGLITRNRYGALVLNTSCVLFVDVDFPRAYPSSFWEGIVWLFIPKKRREAQQAIEEETQNRIGQWAAANPDRPFRLYRTRRGLRMLFTDGLYEPAGEDTVMILNQLGADPLYKKLTQKQECFRARLTPKPWRCNCSRPLGRYPWTSEAEETRYRQWEETYAKAISGYKTCQLLGQSGGGIQHEIIQMIVNVHDDWTCNEAPLPLA